MIEICYTDIESVSLDELSAFLNLFEDTKKQEILSAKNLKTRCSSIIARLLIVYYINKNMPAAKLIPYIKYDLSGKPYIDNCDLLNISISHSNNIVGCAFSISSHIGFDVEYIQNIPIEEYIDVFTNDEYMYIVNSNDKLIHFYSMWVQKEAVLKAIGYGFLLSPLEINVLKSPVLYNEEYYYKNADYFENEYIYSIASKKKADSGISKISMNKLIEFLKKLCISQ